MRLREGLSWIGAAATLTFPCGDVGGLRSDELRAKHVKPDDLHPDLPPTPPS
ncbi:hypothetical protein [Pseudoruegeria sp. SK021]|uniref:hypothetical protein n=1 Tax=Pseudoruegeria sp. SK021 TaxID=1933035 RepID=UPI00143CED85|nr:hypothetical protein [Pseudoruegeria sp. SK021]